jgi:dihydrofolate reductase
MVRDECFVIGGARLYLDALPRADRILLTDVRADVEGDVAFPDLDPATWRETAREAHAADARHALAFDFVTLERDPAV